APGLVNLYVGKDIVERNVPSKDADERLVALLKKHGVEPSWGPIRRDAYARAEIRDPDGNVIELRQWL
ncbi:MAG: hypothetical protein ACREUE_16935, partial [Panacagrimonas sp.]